MGGCRVFFDGGGGGDGGTVVQGLSEAGRSAEELRVLPCGGEEGVLCRVSLKGERRVGSCMF
jgi:hypothetical protein